jgi:hypothetical protein
VFKNRSIYFENRKSAKEEIHLMEKGKTYQTENTIINPHWKIKEIFLITKPFLPQEHLINHNRS